jgi:carbon monoxide dehydrogenase subunit G
MGEIVHMPMTLKHSRDLLLCTLIGLSCVSTPSAQAAQASPKPSVNSSKGHGNIEYIHAETDINSPPSIVWNTLTDFTVMNKTWPGSQKADVLETSAKSRTVLFALKIAALVPAVQYKALVTENKAQQTILIRRIAGDFDELHFTYKLQPRNNGTATHLTYNLEIDPGEFVPGLGWMLKNNSRDGLQHVKSRCEKLSPRSNAYLTSR